MSNNKHDLTRIEDLGEFIHELNNSDDTPDSETSESDLPEIPSFGEEETSFETSEDFSSTFGSESTESTESSFSTDFTDGENSSNEEMTPEWNTESETETETEIESPIQTQKEFTSTFDDQPSFNEPEPEVSQTYTPEPIVEVRSDYKTPETFEDLKKFSESSSFSGMATEGNPSFSVLVKNVRFIEDVSDIVLLLKEFNLLVDSEEQTKARLMRGMLLIPRISEYAAIHLAHKLRRFDVDIQLGLSDEIHPPKHLETPETGIISKHNLYQNQSHHFHFDDAKVDLDQIIVSATSSLDGYQILKYMGVASEHKIMDGLIVEDENSKEVTGFYHELAQKLKAHAMKANANAVVGLNYQLTPLPSDFGLGTSKYRLSCTGNLVWINKI